MKSTAMNELRREYLRLKLAEPTPMSEAEAVIINGFIEAGVTLLMQAQLAEVSLNVIERVSELALDFRAAGYDSIDIIMVAKNSAQPALVDEWLMQAQGAKTLDEVLSTMQTTNPESVAALIFPIADLPACSKPY